MRPERLELEGFMAFRKRTVVEFGDAELFVLTGPTGAGKSTVIDAILFALFGSVPRHGKRDVAPVVTQGRLQGRVQLDFTVAGVHYTVARVVRRDAKGRANTDEARLEHGDDVIASGAREVDEAVTALIGLDYDQFTTCVVLPQGDFERFLHAKPSERQGLLIALLDLGIYDRLADLATQRQRHAEGRLSEIDAIAQGVSGISKDDLEAAELRVGELRTLLQEVEDSAAKIERLRQEETELAGRIATFDEQLTRLGGVAMPDGAEVIAERIEEARGRREEAGQQAAEAERLALEAEAQIGPVPPPEYERVIGLRQTMEREQARNEELRVAAAKADESVESARSRRDRIQATVDDLKSRDLAAHLRSGLKPGDLCPVCGQVVDGLPDVETIDGLDEALTELKAAESAVGAGEREAATVRITAAEIVRRITSVRVELESVEWLEQDRSIGGLEEARDRAVQAANRLADLRRLVTQRRRAVDEAATEVRGLAEQERSLQGDLQTSRDRVAALEPPAIDPADVVGSWKALRRWADDLIPTVRAQRDESERKRAQCRQKFVHIDESLRARCRALNVELRDGRVRDTVVDALAEARTAAERIARQLEQAKALAEERAGVEGLAAVAKELARHLRANNFEKWLLDEALRVLASGANRRLEELARGQYSLALSSRLDFEVIDHFAADERRPVRSLSGGETFLVSLALALSLADHVAEMATLGVNRLESIFLDEGFGTLDQETLDTVASVIAEIGSGGKTVGLITHVKELAEQVPVRFRVTRGAEGASVERTETV